MNVKCPSYFKTMLKWNITPKKFKLAEFIKDTPISLEEGIKLECVLYPRGYKDEQYGLMDKRSTILALQTTNNNIPNNIQSFTVYYEFYISDKSDKSDKFYPNPKDNEDAGCWNRDVLKYKKWKTKELNIKYYVELINIEYNEYNEYNDCHIIILKKN